MNAHPFSILLVRLKRSLSRRGTAAARTNRLFVRPFRPRLEPLDERLAPALMAVGAGPGGPPVVSVIDKSGAVVHSFLAYDVGFTGGVNVAVGDVTGDGIADIVTGTGPGGGPHVKAFDGATYGEVLSFFAYDAAFTGGVNVAVIDANGDGAADIVTGSGAGGGPQVQVFNGRTLAVIHSFFAFDAAFTGGVNVAVGDLNGDLLPDIIAAAASGGGPHVRAFDGITGTDVGSFFAYDPAFAGGVNLATGDVDGNGTTEVITGAGPGGGPHVRAWTGGTAPTEIGGFMALGGTETGGVRVGGVPGEGGAPDLIAATRQAAAGPMEIADLAGQVVATNGVAAGGISGFSISSPVPQPDLLIRYHTLSQIASDGGAGRLEPVGGGLYKLTINGVGPDTRLTWFADAPGRGTGQDTATEFANRIWPRQYGALGATAILSSVVGDLHSGYLLHLTNPRSDAAAGTLAFDATILDQDDEVSQALDMDRLILGFSPSDLTNAGLPIPAVNRGEVRSFAIAALGGTIAGDGTTGTLTLEIPYSQTVRFGGVPTADRFVESIDDFVAYFTRRFGDNTPNAAVTYQDEAGALRTVTVNLASARMEDGNAAFDVAFTGPVSPGRMAMPLLFVDNQATANPAEMPTQTANSLGDVVFTNDTLVGLNKQLTITNNSKRTVYPFIRGVNNGYFQNNRAENWAYDTMDRPNEEYRAYIGFYDAKNKKYYFGLQQNKSITINVPLAFWDGARIGVATDDAYLTNELKVGDVNINNPLQYYRYESDGTTETRRYIDQDPKRVSGDNGGPGNKPVVMYYHSAIPKAPAAEAADQLLEYTIRDPYQRVLNPKLPDPVTNSAYLGPLFNYDISYVDSIMLPVAMAAPKVPVSNVSASLPFGWVGAPQTYEQFQQALKDFTSSVSAKNGLGQYFNGGGWNKYYVPDEAAMGVKLPATKNIFEQSPLNGSISAYFTGDNNSITHHILASGGIRLQVDTSKSGEIKKDGFTILNVKSDVIEQLAVGMLTNNPTNFSAGTAIAELGDTWIRLNAPAIKDWTTGDSITFVGSRFADVSGSRNGSTITIDDKDKSLITNLKVGMLVAADGPGVAAGSRIHAIDAAKGTITLTPIQTGSAKQKFTFSGGISDYVAERLLGLWYGWADYYASYVARLNPFVGSIPGGTIVQGERKIAFAPNANLTKLRPGMGVTGPGIAPGTTITKVGDNDNVIVLSKVAGAAQNAAFTFALPKKIIRSPEVTPLVLDFSAAGAADQARANQFAQVLYTVMDGFSTIPKKTLNSASIELMQNIIGGNVTQIPGIGAENSPVWRELTVFFRDASKSLERGVYDFIALPEATGQWYPDPAASTAGAKVNGQVAGFNLYNLDPFVWFVHKRLGVSGYAFSLDDDSADVGATGSTTLQVSIGGLGGMPVKAEWFVGAPYGPVTGAWTAVKGATAAAPDKITGMSKLDRGKLVNPNIADGVYGAFVIGPGVQPGTRVARFFLDDTVELDTKLGDIGTQPATYSFFGPFHATGTINPTANAKQIANVDADSMKVLDAITAGGKLLPGALVVLGPGIKASATPNRVMAINVAARTITLEQALDPAQIAGEYRFKFT